MTMSFHENTESHDSFSDKIDLQPANPSTQPVCLIPGGRGHLGKTLIARWAYERAQNDGRLVLLADGDRTNQSLRGYFKNASFPPSADPAAVQIWLESEIEQAAAKRKSIIIDFGAGDLTLKKMATELALAQTLEEMGLRPVALYCVGADPDDLSALFSLYEAYAPPSIIIAFTTFSLPRHVSPVEALETITHRHPDLGRILDQGAEIIPVPVLTCAHKLSDRRMNFHEAASGEGPDPLGPFDRQRVTTWLRFMQDAFAPVAHWLP